MTKTCQHPYWPGDRYLELAPQNWQSTRARLRADELEAPIASFTIPPPPLPADAPPDAA